VLIHPADQPLLLLHTRQWSRKNLTLARRHARQGLLPRAPAGELPGTEERSESPHRRRLMNIWRARMNRDEGELGEGSASAAGAEHCRDVGAGGSWLLKPHWQGLTPELSRPARCDSAGAETAKRARLERIVSPQALMLLSLATDCRLAARLRLPEKTSMLSCRLPGSVTGRSYNPRVMA
jgi:hypothetical protein